MRTGRRPWIPGLLAGLILGAGAVAIYERVAGPGGMRGLPTIAEQDLSERLTRLHEEATAAFLDVPEGRIHARAVPSRAAFLPGDVDMPGSLATDIDAMWEFLRDENRRWFVHLVEIAVPTTGILTVDVVDRPGEVAEGRTLGRLRTYAEPGRAHLVGFGVEQQPGRPTIDGGPWRMSEGWRETEELRAAAATPRLGPLRLFAAGGKHADDTDSGVRSRFTTGILRPSAWGQTHVRDVPWPHGMLDELAPLQARWIHGPPMALRTHVAAPTGLPTLLGLVAWTPGERPPGTTRGTHGSWANGRIKDVVVDGDVVITRTNMGITLTVGGQQIRPQDYPYPLWALRVMFEPEG